MAGTESASKEVAGKEIASKEIASKEMAGKEFKGKGPFNYYVTLFWPILTPLHLVTKCHTVPPPRNVTLVRRPGLKPVIST